MTLQEEYKKKKKLLELKKELLEIEAKEDFWLFCLYWDYDFFSTRYVLKPVAKELMRLHNNEIQHLGVSLPPRYGKSYLISLFSVWTLGKDNKGSIMRNATTTRLAEKFSYDIRSMILNNKFLKVFPDTKLKQDKKSVNSWQLETADQVSYFCGGTGSSIIGFGCKNYAITDDLYKGIAQAYSNTYNSKAWEWFTGEHLSRLEKGCKTIDIGTRWKDDDVLGVLDERDYFDVYIVIPALDERGETTCEEVKSTEEYLEVKKITDSVIWEAEYQQNPIPKEGLLYTKFKTYNILPQGTIKCIVDTADGGNDYFAAAFYVENLGKCYIFDFIYNKNDIMDNIRLITEKIIKHSPQLAIFESNSAGKTIAKQVKEKVFKRQHYKSTFRWFHQSQNKETRLLANSALVQEYIYYPENWDIAFPEIFKSMIRFKKSGGNENDDIQDVITSIIEKRT